MNYRHAFHAGNFGDCMKHALLVWLVDALHRKPAPLFVLDTHAGAGRYDLCGGPAERTGEWRDGIGRLLDAPPPALQRYAGLVRAPQTSPFPGREGSGREDISARAFDTAPPSASELPGHSPSGPQRKGGFDRAIPLLSYPGSPVLIAALLRPDDRLACCELHPEDVVPLRRQFARDPRVAVHHRNAYEALGALLPPAQKRGLVLIDPPFEDAQEFATLAAAIVRAHARFRTGVFAVWYPIKHRAPVRAFHDAILATGISDIVAAELVFREPLDPARLNGCGLLVINPPYRFEAETQPLLEALLDRLGNREAGEGATITRLADE